MINQNLPQRSKHPFFGTRISCGLAGLFLVILALFVCAPQCSASATSIYLAQNAVGAANGADCSDAYAYGFFNTQANWGSASTQIGPGTTVHLCGTFTGSAGSTMLTTQGSGTSGNPIVIQFETGAQLTAPYWSGNPNGAMVIANDYITVNGQNPNNTQNLGQIVATQNGTGLMYQNGEWGMSVKGSNVLVENIAILNMYQRSGSGHEITDASPFATIDVSGANVTLDNITSIQSGWGIDAETTADNFILRNSSMSLSCHSTVPNAPHWMEYNNHYFNSSNWDSDDNFCHEDYIHCYANVTISAYVYNNRFDGAWGNNFNQPIFLEGGSSPTRCFVNGGVSYTFNNIIIGNGTGSNYGGPPNGGASVNVTNNGDIMSNNLEIGNSPTTNTPQGIQLAGVPNSSCTTCGQSWYNNALSGIGYSLSLGVVSTHEILDYDAFETCGAGANGCFIAAGTSCSGCSTLAGLQSATLAVGQEYEQHGIDNRGASESGAQNAYFKLNSACTPGSVGANCQPTSNSPLIAAGKNLFSICNGQPNPGLGAMCFDILGNARPSAGAWDIGPYQSSGAGANSSAPPPVPPTGLVATVN